ncbi:MAG: NAD-dependent epimerase/dehydratase family protein [Pseudomonadota bacterium]
MRVFVTGSSSGLAAALLPRLCASEAVSAVVGLDLRPTAFQHPKFECRQGDMCAPGLEQAMQGCQAVVHAGYAVMQRELSNAQLYANNVGGALQVFKAARAVGAVRTINISSVSVYGSGENLDENAPLKPSPLFTYARHKARIERLTRADFPEVVHLRAHLIFGPHSQPFLRQMCQAWFCIMPPAPVARLQVVHEDDVADAVCRCLMSRDVHGTFNLAASEVVTLPALVRHGRRGVVPLPLAWVQRLVRVARLLGHRDEYTWLDVMGTTLTVQCQRAEQLLGWRATRTPWQAVDDTRRWAVVPAVTFEGKHP